MHDFAAYYIIQNIITPGYWEDKNLTVVEDEDKKTSHIRSTLKNVSARKIRNFAKNYFDVGIQRYAEALKTTKACTIRYVDVKEYLEYPHNMRALLYIDPPKYLREEKRFQFGYDGYCNLFAMLRVYEGDWILVWKNYVEKSAGKESIYDGLYTQNKIEQDEDWIEKDDSLTGNENGLAGEDGDSIPQIRQNDIVKAIWYAR